MLSREHPITTIAGSLWRVDWKLVPDVTMEDADIVESMVAWWASATAHWMRDAVEAQLKAREATEFLYTDARRAACTTTGDD